MEIRVAYFTYPPGLFTLWELCLIDDIVRHIGVDGITIKNEFCIFIELPISILKVATIRGVILVDAMEDTVTVVPFIFLTYNFSHCIWEVGRSYTVHYNLSNCNSM